MYLGRVCLLLLALAAAACSQTPTAPSATSPAAAISSISQSTAPVAPRISVTPAAALGATRFVAFGDSITWGVTSSFDERLLVMAANGGYPERLLTSLNFYHRPQQFTVINEGLPGELASLAVSRFRTMLTTRKPQAVLLLEGINDLANEVSISKAVTGLQQMLDAAAVANTPVVIATMFQTYEVTNPNGDFRPNGAEFVPEFNRRLKQMATGRLNVYVLDLYPLMTNRSLVGNDGLHLTDEGFEVMASAFLDAVEKAFPVRGSFQ